MRLTTRVYGIFSSSNPVNLWYAVCCGWWAALDMLWHMHNAQYTCSCNRSSPSSVVLMMISHQISTFTFLSERHHAHRMPRHPYNFCSCFSPLLFLNRVNLWCRVTLVANITHTHVSKILQWCMHTKCIIVIWYGAQNMREHQCIQKGEWRITERGRERYSILGSLYAKLECWSSQGVQ